MEPASLANSSYEIQQRTCGRVHRGFSAAFSNGCSASFSNRILHFSGIFQRTVTCPVDFYLNSPMDFQWHSPIYFYFCDFWCAMLPCVWARRPRIAGQLIMIIIMILISLSLSIHIYIYIYIIIMIVIMIVRIY